MDILDLIKEIAGNDDLKGLLEGEIDLDAIMALATEHGIENLLPEDIEKGLDIYKSLDDSPLGGILGGLLGGK